MSLFSQTATSSSIKYHNVSGDNAIVRDTTTYSNGSLTVAVTQTLDSTALRTLMVSDSVVDYQSYIAALLESQ